MSSSDVLELQAVAKLEATLKAKLEAVKMVLEERFGFLPAELVQRIEATTDLGSRPHQPAG